MPLPERVITGGWKRVAEGPAASASSEQNRDRLAAVHRRTVSALAQVQYPGVEFPGAGAGPRADRWRAATERQVGEILAAHAGCPGLSRLWAKVGTSSLGEPPWVSGSDSAGSEPPCRALGAATSGWPATALVDRSGVCQGALLVAPVLTGSVPVGWVVGEFETVLLGLAAREEVSQIARDLELLVHLLRRAEDQDALGELSRILTSAVEPTRMLTQIAKLICAAMSSTHAKVQIVQRSSQGLVLDAICRTDEVAGQQTGRTFPLSSPSLSRWVLENDDWLLVPETVPPEEAGRKPERAITGSHGEVFLKSLPSRGRGFDDDESTMLYVPLYSSGKPAGALAVWRDRHQVAPYNPVLDTSSLLRFAPHVASACAGALEIRQANAELNEIHALENRLATARTLKEMMQALASGVRRLVAAPAVVLLSFERDDDAGADGHLFVSAADHEKTVQLPEELRTALIACPSDPLSWEEWIRSQLPGLTGAPSPRGFGLRCLIRCPGSAASPPALAAAILDSARAEPSQEVFGEDLLLRRGQSFLDYARRLLARQTPILASAIMQAEPKGFRVERDAGMEVLFPAASLLRNATGADVALVYLGDSLASMRIAGSDPDYPQVKDLPVGSSSLTAKSISSRKPRRVLSVSLDRERVHHQLDHSAMAELRERLGGTEIRSWLCCPMVHGQRLVGLIKLVSTTSGPYFGEEHLQLAEAVANLAAAELHKTFRQRVLDDLNRMGNELSSYEGALLEKQMLRQLEEWSQRFLRADCAVAVVAGVRELEPLARIASPPLRAILSSLQEHSMRWWQAGRSSPPGPATLLLPSDKSSGRPQCLAAKIDLPGEEPLEGHLYFAYQGDMTNEDRTFAADAAREIALVLHVERVRRNWARQAARFGHALIGPVQGLSSAARLLGRHARHSPAKSEVQQLIGLVEKEAHTIQVWRDLRRLYRQDNIEVRPFRQKLRPLVERCFERFRALAERRNIKYSLAWHPRGDLSFAFDAFALDVALSNLIENACKYAFYNREITLGVQQGRDGSCVYLWVEDIGQGIPEGLSQTIYGEGARSTFRDPFRVIPGEGVGLPMARAFVERQNGRLQHSSVPEGRVDGPTTPYRVRFTIELPTGWESAPI